MPTITRKTTSHVTWNTIKTLIQNGRAREALSVGDEIAETLTTGEQVVIVVAGIDVYAERQVIFSLKDCLEDKRRMNADWTNKGGYPATELRQKLNDEILSTLPADLRDIITPRTLTTDDGECADMLWLFSEYEIHGEDWCNKDPGDAHIPYYQNPVNRCKGLGLGGDTDWWWARSPRSSHSTSFCNVGRFGAASYSFASSARDVCFGFCV